MIETRSSDIVRAGAPGNRSRAAVVLLHGRGSSAQNMLSFADAFAQPDVAYFAAQAPGNTWYPYSFMAPLAQNEPALSRSLAMVGHVLSEIAGEGTPPERTVLLGFSQGGCLALEYAARNAARYGGVVGLSAGLIGPEGTPRDYQGSFGGAPMFLGCGDVDSHIPIARVHESTKVLQEMGADVTERIYDGMGHVINDDEIRWVRGLLARVQQAAS